MLAAVQRHYVMVDDKLRFLTAMKAIWQERLSTIFARQVRYALERAVVAAQAVADFTIERIGEYANSPISTSPLIKRPADEARATLEMPCTPQHQEAA